ncbi:MAG TPA: signal recognition particle-docking protein FtsY [Armatimonadetes bacterium]|nr:signal recognition particle-docking protein FtsY [Armatimonadota bacterium]
MLKGLFGRVKNLVRGRATIDDDLMEELEEALIEADVPIRIALSLVEETRDRAERDHVTEGDGLLQIMRNIVRRQLTPFEAPLNHSEQPPTVFLMLGVNGVGKTTTLAKLAHRYQSAGKNTMMVAADTFRAAAIEQCEVWAGRVKCDIVRQEIGADPGAVVFDALQAAKARDTHIALIDTAGRLHTKQNLMAELQKIGRIVEREMGRPADERLLVIDATTGQNALNQAREFHGAIGLTGLVLTKLDGTAKGGVALSVVEELGVPIKLIGVGEKMDDLVDFSAEEFADAMLEG